jgi:hypothetical protein
VAPEQEEGFVATADDAEVLCPAGARDLTQRYGRVVGAQIPCEAGGRACPNLIAGGAALTLWANVSTDRQCRFSGQADYQPPPDRSPACGFGPTSSIVGVAL